MSRQFPVSLRRLRKEDVDQVLEIEREAFSPLWVSSPFKRDLNNKYASYLVASLGAETSAQEIEAQDPVADISPKPSIWSRWFGRLGLSSDIDSEASPEKFDLAGYVSVWYQGEEAHITEIAVREERRGNGIGELLLIGSLREAVKYGSTVMTLEARVSNVIAQRLYEKYGFKDVGVPQLRVQRLRRSDIELLLRSLGTSDPTFPSQ